MAERWLNAAFGFAERVRLLPVVMLAATMLLTVKLGHVVPTIGAALAESKGGGKAPASNAAKVTPEEIANAKMPERGPSPSSQQPLATPAPSLSQAEIDVLQTLSKRREQLEADAAKREKDLSLRASLLTATEAKVEERIAELKKIEAQIAALLKKYDEQEEKRLKSLVKIYENMKPKDVVRIFDEMESAMVLDMIERMKDKQISTILSLMEPAKARKITQDLLTRRPLPSKG